MLVLRSSLARGSTKMIATTKHKALVFQALRHTFRAFSRVPRPYQQMLTCATTAKEHEAVEELPESEYFSESFIRAGLLGIGSGVMLEGLHVLLQFLGIVESVGASDVFAIIKDHPSLLNSFEPLLYVDHAAGILGWLLFYIIDALAISAVLDMYKDDKAAAGTAIKNLVTLPKIMMPVRLALFRSFLMPGAATGTAAAGSGAISSGTPSAFVDTSGATTPTTTPPTSAPPTNSPPKRVNGANNIMVLPPTAKPLPRRPAPQPRPDPDEEEEEEEVDSVQDQVIKEQERRALLKEKRSKEGLVPGQLAPDSLVFSRRQKELAGREAYLKNFWYAAAASENIKPGKPHAVEMLGRKIVLFREESTGLVRCLDDVCPHRGAPLSSGHMRVIDGKDCVTCGYHGWAIDAEGKLRDVPAAESKGAWPRRQVVPSYPVAEKGGFVWLFNGSEAVPEEERPPIPFSAELEAEGWKAVYGEIEFDCGHFSVFENAIDMAHIHYLHGDSFGNEDKPEIRDMQCTSDAFSITATFSLHNKPVSPLWEFSKVDAVQVTAKAFLPSTSVISFTLGNGLSFTTFVNTVPVSKNKTVNRFALVRNLAWDKTGVFNANAWDTWARKAMMRILGEDKVMVEQLRPDLIAQEFSVRADLPQVEFRKLRQQWLDMGYGQHPEAASYAPGTPDRKNKDM